MSEGTMAERSKELLELEHKNKPASSLEPSTLVVCNGNTRASPITLTNNHPPNGSPFTASLPASQLLGKVKDFLGVMSKANNRLEFDAKDNPKNYDIEELTGNESQVIEMDLMLGVADLHTPEAVAAAESAITSCQPVIPLAGDDSETDSDDNGDDENNDDDDGHDNDGKLLPSLVERSNSRKDNILHKRKGNHSIKRPKIVELS